MALSCSASVSTPDGHIPLDLHRRRMSPTRRQVLAQLAALAVLPRTPWNVVVSDPLDGTIADYHNGLVHGQWSAE